MNRLFALARSVAAVSLLAACGGGGSAPDVGTRPVGEAEVVADVPSTRTDGVHTRWTRWVRCW